jgi:hypothetical protein
MHLPDIDLDGFEARTVAVFDKPQYYQLTPQFFLTVPSKEFA